MLCHLKMLITILQWPIIEESLYTSVNTLQQWLDEGFCTRSVTADKGDPIISIFPECDCVFLFWSDHFLGVCPQRPW